jgi:GNAT superfamily N-acetyltransferase
LIIRSGIDLGWHDLVRGCEIDSVVYNEVDRDTIENIYARFVKDKSLYFAAMNSDVIVGYLAAFPISESYRDKMLSHGMESDSDIVPDDVVVGSSTLYLISVAILPEYQDTKVITYLLQELKSKLAKRKDYKRVIAHAVSDAGYKMMKRLGFEVKLLTDHGTRVMEAPMDLVLSNIQT